MKIFDNEPHPIMGYVNELECKVRELQGKNRALIGNMVYVVGAKSPISLGVGYIVGLLFGIVVGWFFRSKIG